MALTHSIALRTNNVQAGFFKQAAGTKRFAYNWALNKKRELYEARKVILEHNAREEAVSIWSCKYGVHREPLLYIVPRNPSEGDLRKLLNSIKGDFFPWMKDVPRSVVAQAVKDHDNAMKRFFKHISRYPRFKKKGKAQDSFYLDNQNIKLKHEGKRSYIFIPKLGWVRMCESLRFKVAKENILKVTIKRIAQRWFVQITVKIDEPVLPYKVESQENGGIDFGVGKEAVLSTGEEFVGPKAYRKGEKRLRLLQRRLSRKKKGSSNYKKALLAVQKQHAHMVNVRKDFTHKMTTDVVGRFGMIALENLNIKGMVKNRRLSKSIYDSSLYEIKRQFIYKGKLYGTRIVEVDRWFPSSKLCSHCWSKTQGDMDLSVRAWTCETCGTAYDRDRNAAINLCKAVEEADSSAVFACGKESSTVISIGGCNFTLKNLA